MAGWEMATPIQDGRGEWVGTNRGKAATWRPVEPTNREERRLALRQSKREKRKPTEQLKKERRKKKSR